jgi:hypothetical protein
LFSRITFREPLFVGGPGNTTGLADKLPTEDGLKGCIRHLEVNDHVYSFNLAPLGDSVKGFDVGKYSSREEIWRQTLEIKNRLQSARVKEIPVT